jgi:hypothetical protein
MKFNLPKVNIHWSLNFVIAFILLNFICAVIHEFGHYIVAVALGNAQYMTFSAGVPKDLSIPIDSYGMLLSLAGGMFVTYFLAYLGLFLLLFSKRFQILGISLIIINTIHRLPKPAAFDEEKSLSILGLDPNLVYFTIVPLMLIPLIIAVISIVNKRKLLTAGGLVVLTMAFYEVRVWVDSEFFITPLINGEILPNIFGIHIYVVIVTLVTPVIFIGKYARYLLPGDNEIKEHYKNYET